MLLINNPDYEVLYLNKFIDIFINEFIYTKNNTQNL